ENSCSRRRLDATLARAVTILSELSGPNDNATTNCAGACPMAVAGIYRSGGTRGTCCSNSLIATGPGLVREGLISCRGSRIELSAQIAASKRSKRTVVLEAIPGAPERRGEKR